MEESPLANCGLTFFQCPPYIDGLVARFEDDSVGLDPFFWGSTMTPSATTIAGSLLQQE